MFCHRFYNLVSNCVVLPVWYRCTHKVKQDIDGVDVIIPSHIREVSAKRSKKVVCIGYRFCVDNLAICASHFKSSEHSHFL